MATSMIQAERTLLWTNPSPTSSFGAQTVSLDLSHYDSIEIEYVMQAQYQVSISAHASVGVSAYLFGAAGGNYARQITITTTGVQFAAGIYYAAYGGGGATTSNTVLVPIRIYGIK